MKIFTYWRQKKSQKVDTIAAAKAASSTGSFSLIHTMPAPQQLQVPDHDQLSEVGFSATPADDDQHQAHDIKSLEDMLCPIYSTDLLHYETPIEKNSDANTDISTKDYDMDLMIYQHTLQNAIFSIGTLGRELLNKAAERIDNENILSSLGIPLVDNESLRVAKAEKYCAHLLTDAEGRFLKEIHINGPNASNNSTNDKVHFNEEIMKRPISSIEEVQVEMQRPYNYIEQESKYAKSIISNCTFNDATLQEELKQQYIDPQPRTCVTGNYHNIENEIGKKQHLLTSMSEELDANTKIVNISHCMQKDMEESHFINYDQLNLLEKTTMKEFLKGLYMHEEVSDDEARKCRSSQGMMGPSRSTLKEVMGPSRSSQGMMGPSRSTLKEVMGPSRSTKEMMGSSRDSQEVISSVRNAQRERTMGSSAGAQWIIGSSDNADGIMGSSRIGQGKMSSPVPNSSAQGILAGSSKNTQGVMDSSPSAQGIMDSSVLNARGIISSSMNTQGICTVQGMMGPSRSAQEITSCSSSTDIVKGIRGSEQARITIVNSIPKDNKSKFDEEIDNENIATRNKFLKLASTCNHHMDLKRLIAAVTPNYLAKHLFKRLKLGHKQIQMNRPDCNYQCKFYKLLRMLGMKQSNTKKRELGPLAADQDAHISKKVDNEHELKTSSSLAESSFIFHSNNKIIASNENWISTDDEYVVLELKGSSALNITKLIPYELHAREST